MSQRCLHLAVRDDLRTWLPANTTDLFPVPTDQIEIGFDGRPLPAQAEISVMIHPARWSNQYDEGIEEIHGTNITVSVKGGKVPLDRWGPELMMKAAAGLDFVLEKIKAHVHSNYDIMNAANTLINSTLGTSNGFVRPLFFRDGGSPQPKGGSWWTARGKERMGGLAQTLRFDDAQRDQTVESDT